MRILITGDWHIRERKPRNRKVVGNSYLADIFDKLIWVFTLAKEKDCDLILQPGDFFDSHKANDFLEQTMTNFLLEWGIDVATVFGQHDLRFHNSDVDNTPLKVLESAKAVKILNRKFPLCYPDKDKKGKDWFYIYGCSWHEELPDDIIQLNQLNILVAHKMVVREKLWGQQRDHSFVNIFMRKNPQFKVIVTGDNHNGFAYSNGERHLINCGALMRTGIDQEEHEPYVYIYDTITNKMQGHPIPVKPFTTIMDKDKAVREKEKNERMEAFVEEIKKSFREEGLEFVERSGLNFSKNLEEYIKNNNVSPMVCNAISKIMEGL